MTTEKRDDDALDLAALLALAGKATKGPWHVVGKPWLPDGVPAYVVAGNSDPHVGKCVLDAPEIDEWPVDEDDPEAGPDYSQSDADLAYAVAACNALPALARRLMRAEEELALWRPLTPAEAEAALDAAEAVPLSEERIAEIVKRATDPAVRLPNDEQAQLVAKVARLMDENRSLRASLELEQRLNASNTAELLRRAAGLEAELARLRAAKEDDKP